MKRLTTILAIILFAMTFSSCGSGGGSGSGSGSGSSNVTVNVGGGSSASSAGGIQTASIPSTVSSIRFTISAPDMTTITRTVSVAGQSSISESFNIPNGSNRRFLVEALNSSGTVLYNGEDTVNLNGSTVTLGIALSAVSTTGACSTSSPCNVAIYNHSTTSDISYWTGGNSNAHSMYQTILNADSATRFTVTVITDLTSSTLSGIDILILPDNAVPDTKISAVDSWFASGKGIVVADSALCFLAYQGYIWSGSTGTNGYGTYWDYNSGSSDQKIIASDAMTSGYSVGDVINSVAGDAQMFSSSLPSGFVSLTAKNSDTTKIYVGYINVTSKGRAVVLGPYDSGLGTSSIATTLIRNAVANARN